MKKTQKTYNLDVKSISVISVEVRRYLAENGVANLICNRMGIVMEEILLLLQDEFGEDAALELTLSRKLWKPWIVLQYNGKRFDPADGAQDDTLTGQILSNLGIVPVWSFHAGVNRITFRLPSSGVRAESLLVGAVLMAVLLGVCGTVIPDGIRTFLTTYVLSTLSTIFMKLLSAMAPMLIFLSILSSISGGQGGGSPTDGKYMVLRHILSSVVIASVGTLALFPFFHFLVGAAASESAPFDRAYEMLLDIVPGNIILPFSENNMMQIVILAILLGSILRSLDNRVCALGDTIRDLHSVFLSAVDYICGALPVFIFSSLLSLLWTNGIGIFAKLWKPILAIAVLLTAIILFYIGYVSLKFRCSPRILLCKIWPATMVGLTTASSVAALTKVSEDNHRLGVSQYCSDLSYSLGLSFNKGAVAVMYLACVYYLAEMYQTPVSVGWFVTAGLICLLFGFATPPVSGGVMICVGMMVSYLGISAESLAVAGPLSLLLEFLATGAKVANLHMDILLQANHLKMLDVETLRKE